MKALEEVVHERYVTRHDCVTRSLSDLPQQEATMGLASYYTYGLPTFTVIVIALYLLFTGNGPLCSSFVTAFAEIWRRRFG